MIEPGRLQRLLAFAATLSVLAPAPALGGTSSSFISSLVAHGGIIAPPPGSGRPPTVVPPPAPPKVPAPAPPQRPASPGPTTPGPNGPTAPSNGSGGPSTPLGTAEPDITEWSWWWSFNEDPYVDLRRRVLASSSLTGFEDFYVGQGMRPQSASLAPGRDLIQDRIAPVLIEVLEHSDSANLRAAAVVALAKMHPSFDPASTRARVGNANQDPSSPDSRRERPAARALAALEDSDRNVVQSAILALGILADAESARALCDLLESGERAQQLLRRSSTPEVFRVHAALAAGLVGARCENEEIKRYVVHCLSRVLSERVAAPDLHIACLTSIGLSPLASVEGEVPPEKKERELPAASSRLGQLLFLEDLLYDSKREEYVRAHVPKALGLLARDASEADRAQVKRRMLDALGQRKRDKRLVRYGLIEALGIVGDSDSDEIDIELRAALREVVQEGEVFERNLALLSIAFASSRPGLGAGEPLDGLRGEQVYLLKQLAQGKDRLRPWVSLAMGLQGYHARAAGGLLQDTNGQALRWTLERLRSSSDTAAFSLALGLRRDQEAIPLLLERLGDTNDDEDRGRVAIGLGFLGAREAIEPLTKILRESHYHPILLREVAVALALLGDARVTDELLTILLEARSTSVQAAAVAAIGFVGDMRAIEPLLAVVADEKRTESLRVSAITALGIVCESEALPWSANFTNRMNYNAATETLTSANGTGFLDLR